MAFTYQVVVDSANPHTLDVKVGQGNLEGELARLTAKGATELYQGHQGPSQWITIADPEGNELCLHS